MKNTAGEDEDVEDSVMVSYSRPGEEHDAKRVGQTARDRKHYRFRPKGFQHRLHSKHTKPAHNYIRTNRNGLESMLKHQLCDYPRDGDRPDQQLPSVDCAGGPSV